MPTVEIALTILVSVLSTAAVMWFFTRDERTRRALESTDIVKVARVKPGHRVRVTGKLTVGHATLLAPFSHRVCAHYDALVEERTVEDWRDAWRVVAHETSSSAFFIEDETGKIEIDPTRFDGIIVRDHHKTKGELDVDKARAFLARHGHGGEIPAERALRYREGVLEAGETVTVLGVVREETHGTAKRLVIGDGESLVRASDDPELVK